MDVRDYGYSYPWGKSEVAEMLAPKLPNKARILDVGAGNGIYRDMIGHQFNWSAVELWHETAEHLSKTYNKVYEIDIRDFKYSRSYDLIIFGDILEHLSVEDAKEVLSKAMKHSDRILVAVPYQLEQGALYGNDAETHIQSDLTLKEMRIRYPELNLIHCVTRFMIPIYGYYYWEKAGE